MSETGTIRLLLIEDNDDDAYLIESALDARHELLHRYRDGREAMNALLEGDWDPDVILVDYRLPSLDGVEIIREVTRREDTIASFIMLTADTRIETAIEAMKVGARDFHPKTSGFDQIPEIIDRVYRLHRELIERREYQKALQRSERLFKFALEQLPVPVVVADPVHGIVQHINHPARQLMGVEDADGGPIRLDELGDRLPLSTTAEQTTVVHPLIATLRDGKARKAVELTLERDGENRWVSASAAPLYDEDGQIIAVVGAFPDVSAQKEVSLRLEEINASKDRFFSIIGHDLRNPASLVQMSAQVMRMMFESGKMEKLGTYMDHIDIAVENLLRLLESLLQWGRLQAGKVDFLPDSMNLADAITEAVRPNRFAAEHKQVELRVANRDTIMVWADRHMLQTVLRNLISNAVKFTEKGGRVEVATEVEEEGEMAVVRVRDTGMGIPPEALSEIFEISHQKIQRGTDGERGTGLGLVMCAEIIRRHRGTIAVESEVGKGATVTVRIPRRGPPRPAPEVFLT